MFMRDGLLYKGLLVLLGLLELLILFGRPVGLGLGLVLGLVLRPPPVPVLPGLVPRVVPPPGDPVLPPGLPPELPPEAPREVVPPPGDPVLPPVLPPPPRPACSHSVADRKNEAMRSTGEAASAMLLERQARPGKARGNSNVARPRPGMDVLLSPPGTPEPRPRTSIG